MARDGSGDREVAKTPKIGESEEKVTHLPPNILNDLLISTQADSSVRSSSVAAGSASHDQPSTPAVAQTKFFSKLPQELKDEIYEYVLLDNVDKNGEVEIMGYHEKPSGRGTGRMPRIKASIWAFTKAFETLENRQDFTAATTLLANFLRRHTKFKASCDSLDSRNASMVWTHYAALKALLGPSPPYQNSFCLVVKTWGGSERDTTCDAVAQFLWKELRQWLRSGRSGKMLLSRFELPPSSRNGEDSSMVLRKVCHLINSTKLSGEQVMKLFEVLVCLWK